MKINAATGLPELPEGYFFRIRSVKNEAYWFCDRSYFIVVELRKKRALFGSKEYECRYIRAEDGHIDAEAIATACVALYDHLMEELRFDAISREHIGTYK